MAELWDALDQAQQPPPAPDMWETAAERVRRSVVPPGGRSEGAATRLLDALGIGVYNAAAAPSRLVNAQMEEYRPGMSVQDTPRTMELLPEVAMNVVGTPGLTGGVPADALGMAAKSGPLWSPISLQKLAEPLDMSAHRFKDVRVPVPKIVNPEKLVGGYGVFPPWDLAATNRTATHINDTKLQRPVVAQGGMGFPEANPGLGLASTQGAAQAFETQMAKLAETGKPVYIMPQTMTPQAIDASHHVADPLAQLTAQAPITIKDAKAFDKMMRDEVPDWKGIKSKDFDTYFNNLDMGSKSHAAKRMALEQWQSKGFPNVAGIRHAMSDLGLVDLPGNTIGATISRYTPGKGLLDTTHADYPKGIAAEHMGQLATLAPYDVGAPTIAKALAQRNEENFARGAKSVLTATRHANYPTKGLPTSQYFDDEWLDGIMKFFEMKQR